MRPTKPMRQLTLRQAMRDPRWCDRCHGAGTIWLQRDGVYTGKVGCPCCANANKES